MEINVVSTTFNSGHVKEVAPDQGENSSRTYEELKLPDNLPWAQLLCIKNTFLDVRPTVGNDGLQRKVRQCHSAPPRCVFEEDPLLSEVLNIQKACDRRIANTVAWQQVAGMMTIAMESAINELAKKAEQEV